MLEVKEVEGKGRGLFASRPIKGGEVVLQDLPFLLYPQQSALLTVCSHCLRSLQGCSVTPCPTCSSVAFCSGTCAAAAAADPGSHCVQVCTWLAACNMEGMHDEQQTAMQFLFRAASLLQAATAGLSTACQRREQLQQLAAGPVGAPLALTVERQELHGRLCHALAAAGSRELAASLHVQQVVELLARDETNGYGFLLSVDADGERHLRGSGLFARASLVNHDCLPNVARFDAPDAPAGSPGANAAVQLRALHDIPAGEEILQSYFPLTWTYPERAERCKEQYGFQCVCPRCRVEATWGDGESDEEDHAMGEAHADGMHSHGHGVVPAADCCGHGDPAQHAGPATADASQAGEQPDAGYISMFLFKFVCPVDGCQGTLAPVAPGSDICECNVCGRRRSEAEFLSALEADVLSEEEGI